MPNSTVARPEPDTTTEKEDASTEAPLESVLKRGAGVAIGVWLMGASSEFSSVKVSVCALLLRFVTPKETEVAVRPKARPLLKGVSKDRGP